MTSPSLLARLVAGADQRKTRFHDELGEPVSLSRALRNGPRALLSSVLRLALGYRAAVPWTGYDARAVLDRFLRPDSEVLEFGSGMSTIWYSRRARRVVSIEDHQGWYDKIAPRLRARGNVDYRYVPDRAAYTAPAPGERFDLIMIDGKWRDECAEFAVAHLREGGIIYLDDSDKGICSEGTGEVPRARRLLLEFAAREGLPWREITDFAPTQLFVQRCLMVGGLPA